MKCRTPPIRFWIAVMIFFTTFTNYMLRSNMSLSIISMVKSTGNKSTPTCLHLYNKTLPPPKKNKFSSEAAGYDWSNTQQQIILAAYFYGYFASCLPAGPAAEFFGPWIIIIVANVLSVVLTSLTPLSAHAGAGGVIADRLFIGFLAGLVYPAINVLIVKWAPPNEKGKFLAAMMGNTLGTVVTWPIVSAVTDSFNWYWGFHVLSIIVAGYVIIFGVVVTDTPQKHKCISEEEKTYITESQQGSVSSKKSAPPILRILGSGPYWALVIAQFGNLWALHLLLTYAPKYMSSTMGFNLSDSAGYAALPYLARLICSFIFGIIGDYMRKKEIMSVTKIRKFFIIFSHFIPALCFFLIRLAGCNWAFGLALLVVNQGLNGAVVVGHLINCQDLAPNFAGTLYGWMNFVGGTTGFICPAVTGALLDAYPQSLTGPSLIFMVGGIVLTVTGIIFIIFGSGELQPWNERKEDQKVEPT